MTDLVLFAHLLFKAGMMTGIIPGFAVACWVRKWRAVKFGVEQVPYEIPSGARSTRETKSRTFAFLMAVRRFGQEVPRSTEGKPSDGDRVSPRRTAQRRLDDLTNTGAPWMRVEASQQVSGDGQLAKIADFNSSELNVRATSPSRKREIA
jgi:hypothetical protein